MCDYMDAHILYPQPEPKRKDLSMFIFLTTIVNKHETTIVIRAEHVVSVYSLPKGAATNDAFASCVETVGGEASYVKDDVNFIVNELQRKLAAGKDLV